MAFDPSLTRYRADVARFTPLAPEVERDLALRCQRGDREAARRLCEGNLVPVMRVAYRYRRWGLPMEDLVQEGNVGLLKAVARFDPDRGVPLGIYAQYWIRTEIREYVARHHRVVRLGSSHRERRALRLYRTTREERPEVLAAMSGLTAERAALLLPMLTHAELSLSPGEGFGSIDRLADAHPSAEESLHDEQTRALVARAVAEVVAALSHREAEVVERRLLADEPATLEEIGAAWGVSKQRVAQIERRVKARIRAQLAPIAGEIAR